MSFTFRAVVRTAALCVLGAALAACGSSSSGSGGAGGWSGDGMNPDVDLSDEGEAVSGNVAVTWKNLDPRNPPNAHTLVNASSEVGQRIRSGRSSSVVIKVLEDTEMGALLAGLEGEGFYDHAVKGLGINNVPETQGRKGIVVVHRDGENWGLMLTRGQGGTGVPETYRDCKGIVLLTHMNTEGQEILINVDNPERLFEGPKIKMKR